KGVVAQIKRRNFSFFFAKILKASTGGRCWLCRIREFPHDSCDVLGEAATGYEILVGNVCGGDCISDNRNIITYFRCCHQLLIEMN
ncbi:MAG: hypothetical protein KMY54_00625, partial [Erysipelothrix sp.]|nr:hypothetical protein [Erysipelothrix sp.]